MPGRVRPLLAQRHQPVPYLAPQLDRMSMPSIVQGREGIGLEALAEPIDRGWMTGDDRSGLRLLH
jgi:hypothetical protein